MTMTRQHFELIAEVLSLGVDVIDASEIDMRDRYAKAFADELSRTNPRFDRERFIAAATKGPKQGSDRADLAENPRAA